MKKLKFKTIEKGINEKSLKKLSKSKLNKVRGGCIEVIKFCVCVGTNS